MLKYEWAIDVRYTRGDIVSILDTITSFEVMYYVCIVPHRSDESINPEMKDAIYWIKLKGIKIYPDCTELPKISIDFQSLINEMRTPTPIIKKIPITKEQEQEEKRKLKLKRKVESVEDEISVFKKKRHIEETSSLKEQILLLNVEIKTKVFLLDKYETVRKTTGSEYAKGEAWLKTVISLPFKKYQSFKIKSTDNKKNINDYFKRVRKHLDSKIYKMDYVKDEIMEFLARKITNPNSKGHILALHGSAGTGKSKLLKTLAEALELPFYQINFGGLNDVAVLTGHSETYIGSKPGKLVEILTGAGCMNPIIFLDEIDKVSSNKSKEINGILTHILDEEQNNEFQDNYLSNINIDLSKVFFVIAFNDIDNVSSIVLNRMKVISINEPTVDDKIMIAKEKLIPDIMKLLNLNIDINLNQELLRYIIEYKVSDEKGVRQLKKSIEKIFYKINYLMLIDEYKKDSSLNIEIVNKKEILNIKKAFIDICLEYKKEDNTLHLHMYM